jgi:hypothetical protein
VRPRKRKILNSRTRRRRRQRKRKRKILIGGDLEEMMEAGEFDHLMNGGGWVS